MSSNRHPLGANNHAAIENAPPSAKKTKTPCQVLTFSLSHSPVQVQLLDSNSVYDLVNIICKKTTVGMNERVDEHMWDIHVPGISGSFNSSDEYVDLTDDFGDGPLRKATKTKLGDLGLLIGTTLRLKYDYGSTTHYGITLVGSDESNEDATSFPREKSMEEPFPSQEFQTQEIDLNVVFFQLNQFIQQARTPNLCLFQPGRKKNYGYLERGNGGCRHMIFLPAKPGTDLSDYLHTIDYACQFNYAGYPNHAHYNWYSMIVFPNEFNKSYGEYGKDLEPGFCDMKKAPANDKQAINSIFPKVAALAGYKKDKKVPKGWISYKNATLLICSGSAKSTNCNAPPGTAFHGGDQHHPESPESILFQVKVDVNSIHDLFCVAEGLLRTL